MQNRPLGRTALRIMPLVFGGNVFGWTADKATSFDLLDRFVEAGFNAIDTADSYSAWHPGNKGGESETIIGEWMKARGNRDKLVIITKCGWFGGLGAANVAKAAEASLARLQTDVIDLYLAHKPDPETPYETTLAAFAALIDTGKVRAIGASNLDAAQLADSIAAAKTAGLPRYDVLQPEYNLYDRKSYDGPLRDMCMAEDIGVITYFSLAKGFLSGKYRKAEDTQGSVRAARGGVDKYLNPRGFRILQALDDVAARHGAKPAEIALAWLIARAGVTAPIASATSLAQVESLIASARISLDPDDREQLDAASAEG